MKTCKKRHVRWAILSDLYGVWFPHVKHEWYEKSPDSVTPEEFRALLCDFDWKLKRYKEIWFYYHPGRFHSLYKRLLRITRLRRRVIRFIHLHQIV